MKTMFASFFLMIGSLFGKENEPLKLYPDKTYTIRIDKQLICDWTPTLISMSGIMAYYVCNRPTISDLRDCKKWLIKCPKLLLTSIIFGLTCVFYEYYRPKVAHLINRL